MTQEVRANWRNWKCEESADTGCNAWLEDLLLGPESAALSQWIWCWNGSSGTDEWYEFIHSRRHHLIDHCDSSSFCVAFLVLLLFSGPPLYKGWYFLWRNSTHCRESCQEKEEGWGGGDDPPTEIWTSHSSTIYCYYYYYYYYYQHA
jgi:hypothetical protein